MSNETNANPIARLSDGVLMLRPVDERDTAAVVVCREDAILIGADDWSDGEVSHDAQGALDYINAANEDEEAWLIAIVDVGARALVGTCELWVEDDADGYLELGMALCLAHEPCEPFLARLEPLLAYWAFRALGADEVMVCPDSDDPVLDDVLPALGFVREGQRVGGRGDAQLRYTRMR